MTHDYKLSLPLNFVEFGRNNIDIDSLMLVVIFEIKLKSVYKILSGVLL